ncbi:MAG: ATP-binding protein [Bacteroidales bacterium]
MKAVINNPFLVGGYVSPKFFCDRESECEKIISALENDRNLSLISPRRIGKTGLIHHVFYNLSLRDKGVNCFYIDIFATQSLYDFVVLLGKNVFGQLDDYSEKVLKGIASFFKSARLSFSFDAISGAPNVSLDISPSNAQHSLEEIFNYLKSSGKRCYIAIDEFQQITEYPEKGIEALLRSYIQFCPNVKFIFAGSKKHLMDVIFSSVNRPFYQSTQKIGLNVIPFDTYKPFADGLFNESDKVLNEGVFDFIYSSTLGHTWYIQTILNRLFALDKSSYDISDVEDIINDILEQENATYKTYCEIITKGQLKLLIAIAKENILSSPFDSSFMKRNNLTAVSSVSLGLKSLIDKTLILKDDNGSYFVYDRFFSLWLKREF